MNRYTPNSFRSTVAAALCTLAFSATCIIGAVGPAQAAGVVGTATVALVA